MRKSRFLSMFLAVMMVAVLVLSGCNSNNSKKQSSTAPSKDQKTTKSKSNDVLRVSFGLGESEWKVFNNDIIPAFEQKTGIKVKAVQVESSNLVNKLTAEEKSGKLSIDMFAQDVNGLSGLISRGLVEDLTQYKDIIPKTVIPGMMKVSQYNGKLLFLPYRPNVEVAFYNSKMFKKYGLSAPQNWDQLLQTAKTLKQKTGAGRVAIKANLKDDNILHMFDFIRQAGGDPFVLNDAGSIKAFTFMQKLYPYLAKQSTTADWNTMNKYLEKDSVYLGQNWPFFIPQFHKDGKTEIKAYQGWQGPAGHATTLGGEVIGIPKGSKKTKEAIKFAKYLMSKDVQEVLVSELAWPSVRSDAYGSVKGYQKPYFVAIKNALQHAVPRGNVPYWDDAKQIYLDVFKKVVMQGQPVKANLDKAHNQLKALQDKYKNK